MSMALSESTPVYATDWARMPWADFDMDIASRRRDLGLALVPGRFRPCGLELWLREGAMLCATGG